MGSNHLPINITAKKGEFEISKDLYDCYEPGDLRAQHFVALRRGTLLVQKNTFRFRKHQYLRQFCISLGRSLFKSSRSGCFSGRRIATTEALNAYNTLKQNRMTPETFTREEHLSGESLVNAIRQNAAKNYAWKDIVGSTYAATW